MQDEDSDEIFQTNPPLLTGNWKMEGHVILVLDRGRIVIDPQIVTVIVHNSGVTRGGGWGAEGPGCHPLKKFRYDFSYLFGCHP